MTFYAEFHYLLALNEVLLPHFLLIFVIKEADCMRKMRNNRDFCNFLTFKGGFHGLLASPEYAALSLG